MLWLYTFFALALLGCTPKATSTAQAGVDAAGPELSDAAPSPSVKIISPEADDTLTGNMEMQVEVTLPEKVALVELGINGDWVTVKKSSAKLGVDTLGLPNGQATLGYRVTAADGAVYSDTVQVNVSNPSHRFLSYEFKQTAYANGEDLVLDVEYTEPGLQLEADLTDLDSEFAAGSAEVTDLDDGKYRISYTLSNANDVPDGKRVIVLHAADANGEEIVSNAAVTLRNTPLLPIVVEGGAFIDHGTPPVVLAEQSDAPQLLEVSGNPTLVTGGTLDLALRWDESSDNPAQRIIIRASDNSGYWVVPVDSTEGEQVVRLSLPSLKGESDGANMDLLLTVVNAAGQAIEWVKQTLTTMIVGSGGVQVTLTWDTPVDLDLHVLDPSGKLVDFATLGTGAGELDLDSNASCEIDGRNTENVFWPDGAELPGVYTASVSLYSACEQAAVHYKLTVRACGKVHAFEGDFSAADATEDPNSLGKEVAKVVMNCSQRAHGTARYEKRDTVSGPGGSLPATTASTKVPARFVPVQAIRTTDKKCLAAAITDAQGNYDLRFVNDGDPKYTVQIAAQWGELTAAANSEDCPTFKPLSEVLKLTGADPYKFSSAEVDGSTTPDMTLPIDVSIADNSGAFNIQDVVIQGINWVKTKQGATLPGVKLRWEAGQNTPGGTSYFESTGTAFILSTPADPDEWDDSVIAHEFTHFVIQSLSVNDSPNGNHSGRSVPTLAWNEGVATGFGCDMLGSSLYLDTGVSGGAVVCGNCVDIEGDPNILPGSDGNLITGKIEEEVISSIIWDLLDGTNETHDKLDTSYYAVLGSVFSHFKRPSPNTRGVVGMDLVDFLDGYRCFDQGLTTLLGLPNADPELTTLLSDPSVDFKYDFPASLQCN